MQSSLHVVACDGESSSYLYDGGSDRNLRKLPYCLTKISAMFTRYKSKLRKAASYLVGPGSDSRKTLYRFSYYAPRKRRYNT